MHSINNNISINTRNKPLPWIYQQSRIWWLLFLPFHKSIIINQLCALPGSLYVADRSVHLQLATWSLVVCRARRGFGAAICCNDAVVVVVDDRRQTRRVCHNIWANCGSSWFDYAAAYTCAGSQQCKTAACHRTFDKQVNLQTVCSGWSIDCSTIMPTTEPNAMLMLQND